MSGEEHRSSADKKLRSRLALAAVTAGTVALVASGAATQRVAAAQSAPVRQARILGPEQTGLQAPTGLAFSASKRTFYVLETSGKGVPASASEVVRLTPVAVPTATVRAGSARIAAAVSDPINTVFDPLHSRLLRLSDAGQLLEVQANANGQLDPATFSRRDALRVGLKDPQGMAIDPGSGTLYVLDAAAPRIVSVTPAADGSFATASPSVLDLSQSGLRDLRGLALDPGSGHLFLRSGRSLVELTSTGAIVSTRDLSQTDLASPQGMVFGPSGDLTDAPSAQSLYVADSGGGSTQSSGQIVELSLAAVPTAAAANFTSTVVRTVDTSKWSPPSPDPDGITYVTTPPGRLVISDSEVEETVQGITHFLGANVWETDLLGNVQRSANISKVAPTVVAMTNEPTGTAWDPASGHYYFSDDGADKVFDLDPGADTLIGTSDDSWTSFSTVASGNNDADCEGITFDTLNSHIFTADGVNQEIYEYTKTGTLVSHFDVAQYGVGDPETVEYDPASDTLFTLSNRQSGPIIVQTTTSGMLLQTIDVSAMTGAGGRKPAGLAYAPASDGSGLKHFYVVDRGIDNNTDPNIIDGKMFELTAPQPSGGTNQAPVVDAGPDQTITLPASATLNGTVMDDGLPNPPGTTTKAWSQVSGPCSNCVTFGDPSAEDTTASFPTEGTYVLQLQASDSELTSSDTVTITVNPAGTNDLIFADGFESGSFSAWSLATTGGGDLSVSMAAAHTGTFGMQALINDNTAIYVTDNSPTAEPRYRVRFYLDPNSIAMASGDNFYLLQGRNTSGAAVVRLSLRWNGSQYQLRGALRQDGGSYTSSAWIPISGSAWSSIEFDWRAATAPGANDGGLTIWLNGAQKAGLTGVDNDTLRVESTRFGAVAGIDTGTRGTVFFDDFESHRQNPFGP